MAKIFFKFSAARPSSPERTAASAFRKDSVLMAVMEPPIVWTSRHAARRIFSQME